MLIALLLIQEHEQIQIETRNRLQEPTLTEEAFNQPQDQVLTETCGQLPRPDLIIRELEEVVALHEVAEIMFLHQLREVIQTTQHLHALAQVRHQP